MLFYHRTLVALGSLALVTFFGHHSAIAADQEPGVAPNAPIPSTAASAPAATSSVNAPVPAPTPDAAQESGPSTAAPAQSRVVGSWLATVGVDGLEIPIYRMPGDDKNVLYIAPYHFALDGEAKEGPVVHVVEKRRSFENPKSNDTRLVLTLVRNPQGTRSKIAEQLRRFGIMPEITEANVNPADVFEVEIQDITPNAASHYKFQTVTLKNPSGRVVELDAFIPPTDPGINDGFKEFIQSGGQRFKITQKVYGEAVDWESTLNLNSLLRTQVDLAVSAVGPVIPGDPKKLTSPYVTRDQKDTAVSKAASNFFLEVRKHGEGAEELPFNVEEFIGKLFQEVVIGFNDKTWDEVNASDLTKNGTKGSVLSSFAIKEGRKSKDEVKVKVEAGAKAKFLGFSGSASGSYSKEQVEEIEENLEWKVEGEYHIPVGFKLHRLANHSSDVARNLGVRKMRTSRSPVESQMIITTQAPTTWRLLDFFIDQVDKVTFDAIQKGVGKLPNDPASMKVMGTYLKEKNQSWKEVPKQFVKSKPTLLFQIPPKTTTPDNAPDESGWVATLIVANEAGDNFVHQISFPAAGSARSAEIPVSNLPEAAIHGQDSSPIRYFRFHDTIYGIVRGPLFDTAPSAKPTPVVTPAPAP